MHATQGVAPVTNTFLSVEAAWSYNFVGGLKEYVTIDPQLLDKAYHLVSTYIIHRHNFNLSWNGSLYNPVVANLFNQADRLGIPQAYFQFYCDNLFLQLFPCLDLIRQELTMITPICNDKGDITAFVVGTALH